MFDKIVWYWNVIHYSVYVFMKNQSFSQPTIHAGGFMGGLLMFFTWGIFNCCQPLFSISLGDWIFKSNTNGILFLIGIIIPSFLFNYFVLFREDKYFDYFEEFDKLDKKDLKKYYWVSIVSIVFIGSFFICSFKFTR